MKRGKTSSAFILITFILLFLLTTVGFAETDNDSLVKSSGVLVEEDKGEEQNLELKSELIKATLGAISMEIDRYEKREDEQKEKKIDYLEKMLDIFENMKPEEYLLEGQERVINLFDEKFGVLMPPEFREVEIVVPPSGIGSILEVVGMTRSGPFYHVAGVKGNNLDVFKTQTRYKLEIYLVYKREYAWNIPDYYVYIAAWQPVEDTKPSCLE